MALAVRRQTPARRAPAGWSPFWELEDLHERMGRLMEGAQAGDGVAPWVPAVDIEETEDAWILEAELPGVNRRDIRVDVQDGEVVISGEIKEKERVGILRRRTRRVGEFEFRAALPGHIDADEIDADVKDGVLTVRIPKSEQARSRRIEVRDGREEAREHA
jgi:HSP20 family protein